MLDSIVYTVRVPNPDDHLLHVEMTLRLTQRLDGLVLRMPVWSPGSYLVREYARHVQNLRARDARAEMLHVRQLDKASWRVDLTEESAQELTVTYEVFAHDLNVRANHVDHSHAFFTGVATFMYPEGHLDASAKVFVEVPEGSGWDIATGLPSIEGHPSHFQAADLDVLLDTPFHLGHHEPIEFEVDGAAHRMVFWGRGNLDRERLARDLPKIVELHRDFFDGLPYEDYLFITLLSEDQGGGLEHLNSTALIYPRHGFRCEGEPGDLKDGYTRFLRLVCHEHFHTWNVKRIRPERLGPFDYQRENYTRDLWTVEGVTSYYDTLGLLRAGLITAAQYLERLAASIHQFESTPGRKLHSVQDASFNAWIKLYRPDEHTLNSTVSYYLKGELICAALDLQIRHVTEGARCLDDVLRHLWSELYLKGGRGVPEEGYQQIVETIAEADFDEFFERYVRSTHAFDWDALLAPVGLSLTRGHRTDTPAAWLGAKTRQKDGRTTVTAVPTASPAHRAGLYAGDEIIALNGWRLHSGLEALLRDQRPGDTVDMHVFRRGELRAVTVELGAEPANHYQIVARPDINEQARSLLDGWLGSDSIDPHSYDGEAPS